MSKELVFDVADEGYCWSFLTRSHRRVLIETNFPIHQLSDGDDVMKITGPSVTGESGADVIYTPKNWFLQ